MNSEESATSAGADAGAGQVDPQPQLEQQSEQKHPHQPQSSPIDGYTTPHPQPTPPPPPPPSTRTLKRAKDTRKLRLSPATATPGARRQSDEDEFDTQLAFSLDLEQCAQLEAESIRECSRRNIIDPSSTASVAFRELERLIADTMPNTKSVDAQHQESVPGHDENRPTERPKPYFKQDWVKSRCIPESQRGMQGKESSPRSRSALPPSATLAEPSEIPLPIDGNNIGPSEPPNGSHAFEGGSSNAVEPARKRPRTSNSQAESLPSSDDVPLADSLFRSVTGPLGDSSTSFSATLDALERIVPMLRHRYELEMDYMKGQLAEKELMMDQLRARLRKRITRPRRSINDMSSSLHDVFGP